MKIVIDGRTMRGSTGRYTRQVLTYLQDELTEHDVHILINPKDQGSWVPKVDNFKLHVVNYRPFSLFGEQFALAWYLYKMKADLVWYTMPNQPLLYFKKHITTIHDITLVHFKNVDQNPFVYWVRQTAFKFLLLVESRLSSQIITISEYSKKDISDYTRVNPDKISVTYCAAEPLTWTEAKPIPDLMGKKYILYVGNAFPYKNLKALTDAFESLRNRHHDELHLALAGKKEFFYENLQKYVNDNDYHNVHILGWISDEQLAWLYQNAQAYVFPSLSEGFGLPGLEAMQYDLPVVSSKSTSLPEVNGDAAHYFDGKNTISMAQAIEDVLNDRELRQTLIEAGKKQLTKFSWRSTAQQTSKIIEDNLK